MDAYEIEYVMFMKDLRHYSLLAHNTFGIDAKCRRFVEYDSVEEARMVVKSLTESDEPLMISC